MDMVLEDVIHISAVQLLSDVTKLMQEQTSVDKFGVLEVLALSLAKTINLLEDQNEG